VLKASKKSPPRQSRSRSLSNEGNAFIKRIESLRTNIEIEGKALKRFYKKSEAENLASKKQSERQTLSQVQAANRLLQNQNRKLQDEQIMSRNKVVEKVKGRVRNYAADLKDVAD